MALTVDSQESGGTGHHSATSPDSRAFVNTAGNLLIAAASITDGTFAGGSVTTTGITYGGVAMTKIGAVTYSVANNPNETSLWQLVNPATGSNTLAVSASASGGASIADIMSNAISYSGANTSTPVGAPTTATNTGAGTSPATVNVTGTTNGNRVVCGAQSGGGNGSGFTGGSGSTSLSSKINVSANTAGDNAALGDQSTGGGTVTAALALSPDVWGIIAVEILAAAGAIGMGALLSDRRSALIFGGLISA